MKPALSIRLLVGLSSLVVVARQGRSDSSGGRLCRHADVDLLLPHQEPKRPGQLVPSLTIEIDPDVGTLRVCCTRRESDHCVDQVLVRSPAHSGQRPSAIALLGRGSPLPIFHRHRLGTAACRPAPAAVTSVLGQLRRTVRRRTALDVVTAERGLSLVALMDLSCGARAPRSAAEAPCDP